MEFKKNRYKLAVFDIDGTIYTDRTVSPAVEQALRVLADSGVQLALATGRPTKHMPRPVDSYDFIRYIIGNNGAGVRDVHTDTLLFERGIKPELAREVADAIAEYTQAFNCGFHNRGLITQSSVDDILAEYSPQQTERVRSDLSIFYDVVADPQELRERINASVMKFTCRMPESIMERFMSDISSRFLVECAKADKTCTEITAQGVNKATGLSLLCEHLGITPAEVIDFGDSGNDSAILSLAGFAVAMGNAPQQVKELADFVAPDVKEDGAAVAIHELFGV